jgi:3-deoxy-D-manno-octulosonic-acid transferase
VSPINRSPLRILYLLLSHLVAPIIIAIEGWRELRDPDQRGRVKQRLGFVVPQPRPGCLWIHAVSVGEVQAAAALVRELRQRVPGLDIVLTTVTATGAARARTIFGGEVRHCYLPYDLPGPVRRFLDRIRPRAVVVLETEIWPTLYHELGRRGLPLLIASARISERSLGRYRRVRSLVREALSGKVSVGAQSEVDAARFIALGAPADRVRATGNVKFDLEIPESVIAAGHELRDRCAAERPVWIAGSTHEGEEAAALAAHAVVRTRYPSALLLLVPRHPQRFDAVRALLATAGHPRAERSAGALPAGGDAVFLVDTIGELQMFYAAADAAFVGGSLVPVGGHSLLEPALLGLPVISGPWTQNAADVAQLLAQAGALATVRDPDALARRVIECFDDPARARADGAKGRASVAANRGAVLRVVEMVLPMLRGASASGAAAAPESSGSR